MLDSARCSPPTSPNSPLGFMHSASTFIRRQRQALNSSANAASAASSLMMSFPPVRAAFKLITSTHRRVIADGPRTANRSERPR